MKTQIFHLNKYDLKGHKSSSNFSVNPTLPLLDGPLMLSSPNCVDLSLSLSLSGCFRPCFVIKGSFCRYPIIGKRLNYNRIIENVVDQYHILLYSVFFFIELKVFVHLSHLKLLQIGQTYLKFFVWLEHLIKIHLKYHKKYF